MAAIACLRRAGARLEVALAGACVWAFNFHGINMAVLWLSGRTAPWVTFWWTLAAIGFMARAQRRHEREHQPRRTGQRATAIGEPPARARQEQPRGDHHERRARERAIGIVKRVLDEPAVGEFVGVEVRRVPRRHRA